MDGTPPHASKAEPLRGETQPFDPSWLELEACSKLQAPHGCSVLRTYRAADVSSIAILAIDAGIGLIEVDVVEDVEGLCPQLED